MSKNRTRRGFWATIADFFRELGSFLWDHSVLWLRDLIELVLDLIFFWRR